MYNYEWSRLFGDGAPLGFGAWFHWDLDGTEQAEQPDGLEAVYVTGSGLYVGALWLGGGVAKDAIPFDPLRGEMPRPEGAEPVDGSSDSYLVMLTGPRTTVGHSGRFAVALIAGRDRVDWLAAADRARQHFAHLAATSGGARPLTFALHPNYPNPFNPSTTLYYSLQTQSVVRLELFNLLGQHVRTLVDGPQAAGEYRVIWDATDDRGRRLPSGTYLVRLAAGDRVRSGKMTLVR
jgi:hypothetical protein